MIKKIIVFLLILFASILVYPQETQELIVPEEPRTYTLLFVGDIMLDRGVRHMVEKHGQDYSFPFEKIKDILDKGDLVFGNLESVISDKGRKIGSIYSFRAPPEAIKGLSSFNIVSLANNHAFDYDRDALEDTMKRLTERNILYTGAGFNLEEAHSVKTINLDETSIGFLAYTEFLYEYAWAQENRSGVSVLNQDNLIKDIVKAKQEVDFLIVSFHYGDEYQKTPNQNQRFLSELAINSGADLIIGHHPHVTQLVEEYQGKYIAYSLGNFVFDQYFSEETMKGFILEVKLRDSKVIGVDKMHYQLNEFYQPEPLDKK